MTLALRCSLRHASLALALVSCVGGTSSAGPGGGEGGAGAGAGGAGAASGDFPAAQWTVTPPSGPRVFAAIDDQRFSITGVSSGHLVALDAAGNARYERATSQIGCLARGDAGETAVVIGEELQFLDLDGAVVWSQPAEQPCQLAITSDRVVLAEAGGVRVWNSNGQAITDGQTSADVAALGASSWRRMLDAGGVIGYANLHTVGALTNDGPPIFELDLPDLEVNAVRVTGVEVVVAVSFSEPADICGQVVSPPAGNPRAALISFGTNASCVWNYVLLNQGAAPQSTVIRDLAVAGSGSLYAAGDVAGSLSWGGESLASGSFLVELSLSNITPIRGTDAIFADAIDSTSDGSVLVVSGDDVSLLYP